MKARTVVLAEIDAEDAARHASLPSIIASAADLAGSFYVVPPVRYPDGRLRIKIGGDPVDRVLRDDGQICRWFKGGGDPEVRTHLRRHLEALLPDLRPVAVSALPCVTAYTRHGYPYIGVLDGERIVVLTGGNGIAAKSSDEIGRLGATVAAKGRLDDEGYATDFAVVEHPPGMPSSD